ncbi:nicastrin-like [Dysidea avara]|uniref:nicastrin-like n=1 Tax=Dysidea avara TaxID=196820 RepID=UPI00331E2D9A
MLSHYPLLITISCCIAVCITANDDPNIDDKIYRLLGGVYPCFRLTNATHQIGCSASSTQTRGVVHVINSTEDIDWLQRYGDKRGYIVVMEDRLFNKDNLDRLWRNQGGHLRVNGIIVKHDTNDLIGQIPEEGFSPEHTCPNSLFGLGSDTTCASSPENDWNPLGNSLSYADFGDFPVFSVNGNTFNKIVKCYMEYNRHDNNSDLSYPLCSLEMHADMWVVKDTETCMRRTNLPIYQLSGRAAICEPLGDRNVWTIPLGVPSDLSGEKVILVATKLDSTSFFKDFSFGANNDISAVTVMLAVMNTIGGLLRQGLLNNTDRHFMFVFFQGESYDYIGSSRMVYDIINQGYLYSPPPVNLKRQIRLDTIDSIVELSHVGIQENPDTPSFYVHGNYGESGSKASDMLTTMQMFATNSNINIRNSSSSRIPPASAQSFLRQNSSISTIIISDYDQQYNNHYYGSRFDDINNLNLSFVENSSRVSNDSATVLQLTELSEVITNTLLNLSGHSVNPDDVISDENVVAELLYCFLVHSNCDLFKSVLSPGNAANLRAQPYNRYVTVSSRINGVTIQVYYLMTYMLARQHTTLNQSACNALKKYNNEMWVTSWVRGTAYNDSCHGHSCLGTCLNSSRVQFHFAESPAFDLEDYQSTTYSTWAESTWNAVQLRMYLMTSIEHQVLILIIGMVVQIISLYFSIMCWRRGRTLFTVTAESHHL